MDKKHMAQLQLILFKTQSLNRRRHTSISVLQVCEPSWGRINAPPIANVAASGHHNLINKHHYHSLERENNYCSLFIDATHLPVRDH